MIYWHFFIKIVKNIKNTSFGKLGVRLGFNLTYQHPYTKLIS